MNIWALCQGNQQRRELNIQAWRVVEAQHKSTTRRLVDSLAEHEVLEDLIEGNKPKLTADLQDYDYLLFTPFRYPPLKYGSRFGTIHERGIWYGSQQVSTALAEVAYYRFLFLYDSDAALDYIHVALTAFTASIVTAHGIDLTTPPFLQYQQQITSPTSYEHTQPLGRAMRQAEIQAFLFFSARTPTTAINVGVFDPKAFPTRKPESVSQSWHCLANRNTVEFTRTDQLGQTQVFTFNGDTARRAPTIIPTPKSLYPNGPSA